MNDEDIKILKTQCKSLSIASLQRVLGDDLANTIEEIGGRLTKSFLIDTIIRIKGTGIFNNKSIRDHFCLLANQDQLPSWKSPTKSKKLLDFFNLSESFLPAPSKKREISVSSKPDFILHNYQDYVKRKASNFLLNQNEKKKLMVQLPTGAGKTSLAMESIYDFLRVNKNVCSVVWMAHTDELCEQAVEAFIRGWNQKGTFEVKIIRLWGGNTNSIFSEIQNEEPKFIVSSFQSAYSMLKTRSDKTMHAFTEIRRQSKLLVVDEAHMTLAKTYKDSINMFSGRNCKILGLTATPGRHGIGGDVSETKELAGYYENNLVNMNKFCGKLSPVGYLQSQGILSRVKQRKLITDFDLEISQTDKNRLNDQLTLSQKTLDEVGADSTRNLLIIDQIQKIIDLENRNKILVFASSKDNSDLLAALLMLRGIEAVSITGETEFSYRIDAVKRFREDKFKVLINFNVFTTGFDDPRIDSVVIARPTFSVVLYSQMIGRGLRGEKNGGTKDCLIVDLVDNVHNQPDLNQASDFFHDQWNV